MLVEWESPTDGFIYDRSKSVTARMSRWAITLQPEPLRIDELWAHPSSCAAQCDELEDRMFVGSEMIVSRPKSARRAWPVRSIRMLALISTKSVRQEHDKIIEDARL